MLSALLLYGSPKYQIFHTPKVRALRLLEPKLGESKSAKATQLLSLAGMLSRHKFQQVENTAFWTGVTWKN